MRRKMNVIAMNKFKVKINNNQWLIFHTNYPKEALKLAKQMGFKGLEVKNG